MPHANVWIRKGDMDKWDAIDNKSEFIHNALNGVGGTYTIKQPAKQKVSISELKKIPGVTTADELEEIKYEPIN